jgi:hypothetical protein
MGLAPPASRVAQLESESGTLAADAGLRRRWAEALALEELILARPALLLSQAPSLEEGRWVEAMRRVEGKPVRARRPRPSKPR